MAGHCRQFISQSCSWLTGISTRPAKAQLVQSLYEVAFSYLIFIHVQVNSKFRRPPQISCPEGCVRLCGCKVSRFSDFPTAIFSSKIAIFNSYIDFWPFKTQNEWLFIKNPVLKNFLGLKTQCSISKFYKIIRFLDFYLRIPKMY